MKKPDFWFVIVVLLILLALFLVVMNIHWVFPVPSAEALAKSAVPA